MTTTNADFNAKVAEVWAEASRGSTFAAFAKTFAPSALKRSHVQNTSIFYGKRNHLFLLLCASVPLW